MKTDKITATIHHSLFTIQRAFTLIELLVVISIIAILAGLLLPTLAAAKTHALKTQSKLQISDLVTAIQNYDSAYSRFPVSKAAQDAASAVNSDFTYGTYGIGSTFTVQNPAGYTYQTNNAEVIAILMDITAIDVTAVNTNHQKNPQQTLFLNAKMGDVYHTNGVVGPDLVYRDPWGNPYVISMDLNYNEMCKDAFYCSNAVSGGGLNGLINPDGPSATTENWQYHGKVMVWSAGPNRKIDPVEPANDRENKDNILSWQ